MSHKSTLLVPAFYSLLVLTCFLLQKPLTSDAALMKCVECKHQTCAPPPDNCPLGLVKDSCDCCWICGRTENELCGGKLNLHGRCGQGLKCQMASSYSNFGMCVIDASSTPSSAFQENHPIQKLPKKEDTVKIPPNEMPVFPPKYKESTYKTSETTIMPLIQMDDPRVGHEKEWDPFVVCEPECTVDPQCEPECTVEFCSENPRALCSARRQQDTYCKDPCATTVCRACETRFDPHSSCVYCPYGQKSMEKKKYVDCIKEFGRCVKKGLSGKNNNLSPMKLLESSFYCAVPTC